MTRNERLTPGRENPPRVTGAILAGGFSSRLGQDKASLVLWGKTLTRWVADSLAPLVEASWLITNHPGPHLALGLPLVTDLWPFQGPAGGLRTALFYARTPWVLAAAVDNPFLSPELLAGLTARLPGTSRPAVVCQSARGLEPFPGPGKGCPPRRPAPRESGSRTGRCAGPPPAFHPALLVCCSS